MAPACEPRPVRPDPQPVGHRPVDERIERRVGRRRRIRHGADRARQRPRRLDPLPGVGVRAVRAEADPRPQPARARVRRRRRAAVPCEHALTPIGPRQRRAARRDRRARRPATRTGRRRRRGRSPTRSAPTPAGCASPTPPATPDGDLGHPDCVAALDDAVALLRRSRPRRRRGRLPGSSRRRSARRSARVIQRRDGVDRRATGSATSAASRRPTSSSR